MCFYIRVLFTSVTGKRLSQRNFRMRESRRKKVVQIILWYNCSTRSVTNPPFPFSSK